MSVSASTRRYAQVGQLGAFVLAVYAVLKPLYGPPGRWVLPFVPAADSALIYHLLEAVPNALVVVGLVALYRIQRPHDSPVARGGFLFAILATAGTAVAHTLEHLTPPLFFSLPGIGELDVWMWAYYGAWFGVAFGVSVVGFTSATTRVLDRRAKLLWTVTIPLGVVLPGVFFLVVGSNLAEGFKIAIALSVFAGCFRIVTVTNVRSSVGRTSFTDD